MNSEEVVLLYSAITIIVGLGVNILFFRVVFKKKKRVRANLFTWLCNIGIMEVFNFLLTLGLVRDIDTGGIGGAIGLPLFMLFMFGPALGFFAPSFWALIRFVYIKATPSKGREIIERSPEPKAE